LNMPLLFGLISIEESEDVSQVSFETTVLVCKSAIVWVKTKSLTKFVGPSIYFTNVSLILSSITSSRWSRDLMLWTSSSFGSSFSHFC
jgi:hypothetical protein